MNENLYRERISDSHFVVSANDSSKRLFYSTTLQIHFRIASENKYMEIVFNAKITEHQYEVIWFGQTGKNGFRSSFWFVFLVYFHLTF